MSKNSRETSAEAKRRFSLETKSLPCHLQRHSICLHLTFQTMQQRWGLGKRSNVSVSGNQALGIIPLGKNYSVLSS